MYEEKQAPKLGGVEGHHTAFFSDIQIKTFLKSLIGLVLIFDLLFFIEKINFPSPKNKFEIDISNEIIKLK